MDSVQLTIEWNLHPEFPEENASNLTVQVQYQNGHVAYQTTVPGNIAQTSLALFPGIDYTINLIAYNIDGYVVARPTQFTTLPAGLCC